MHCDLYVVIRPNRLVCVIKMCVWDNHANRRDTLSKPRSAARASERCKAFFTCGADKVHEQFTDLGTATIISSVNLALFFSCRYLVHVIFIAVARAQNVYFIFSVLRAYDLGGSFGSQAISFCGLRISQWRDEKKRNRTGNGNACHGEFRNLHRDFNA